MKMCCKLFIPENTQDKVLKGARKVPQNMSSQGGLDGADGGGGDPIATRYRNISWILDRTHILYSLSITI